VTEAFELVRGAWPKCAKEGCAWPGFFKVEIRDDSGKPFWAYLCFSCIREVRECFAALARLSDEERKLVESSGPLPSIREKEGGPE
jgi:hypothetical protein